jgi:4-amino-4-deoxy-L-arabinose transferase-like glycosyltransferase
MFAQPGTQKMKLSLNALSPFFLPILLVLFVACRLGNLNLPFFWDEAWSYANAVFNMHDHGLALFPGNANAELTRGHPLVFYFLAAAWTKLFGTSLVAVHLFPLLISCLLLIAVYYITCEFFGRNTAMAATLFIALQSIFLAQSTLLLPEVMLALWTLLTVFAYFRKRWGLFAAFSIVLVMTKETGMVLIGTLFVDKIMLERFFAGEPERPRYLRLKESLILCIPILVFASFLTLQKFRFGWFLYPEHTDLIIRDPSEILNGFRIYFSKLFFQYGRNILFLLTLPALGYRLYKKSVGPEHARILLFSIVFILFYIAFASVNFFTPRYLLSVLPFFIITGSWLIVSQPVNEWIRVSVIGALALLFSYHTFLGNQKELDTSLAYRNTIVLQKQAVNFIEDLKVPHSLVYSYFLMNYYMTIPRLGYLKSNNSCFKFTKISDPSCEIFIFCSNEKDPAYQDFSCNPSFILIKRFEKNASWVEIFKRIPLP